MSMQQQNQILLGSKQHNESKSNTPRIKMLKNLVKLLYDDISYEILNYIINLNNEKAEEQTLAEKLNLTYTQVRQSLILMSKHGILIASEFKKKKNEEEEEEKFQINRQNKYKTSKWELNDKFYKIVKDRFEDLAKKLETKLKDKETLKFICPKCKKIFFVEKAAHLEYQCSQCFDKPKLIEHQAENVSDLRRKCNEIISELKNSFDYCDKSAPEFTINYTTTSRTKKAVGDMHANIHLPHVRKSEDNREFQIQFDKSLEDPIIELELNEINKDENKKKKFKEFLEIFFQTSK